MGKGLAKAFPLILVTRNIWNTRRKFWAKLVCFPKVLFSHVLILLEYFCSNSMYQKSDIFRGVKLFVRILLSVCAFLLYSDTVLFSVGSGFEVLGSSEKKKRHTVFKLRIDHPTSTGSVLADVSSLLVKHIAFHDFP